MHAQPPRRRARPAIDHVLEHRQHLKRDLRRQHLLALDVHAGHRVAVGVLDRHETARTDAIPERREDGVRGGEIERRHEAGAERQRRHVGLILDAEIVGQAQHRTRADALLQQDGGGVVRFEQRLAQRERVLLAGALVARNPDALGRVDRDLAEAADGRHRRHAALERHRVDERLEGGARLAAAAHRAVIRRHREVRSADHREQVAGVGIHRDQRRLQPFHAKLPQAVAHGGFRGVLQLGHERRVHLPVGRVVAAVEVAELLAEEFLRVALLRVRDRRLRTDVDLLGARHLFLRRRDLLFLAHAPEDDEAASARRVEVRPRRVGRRRADDAGDHRGFAERQLRCRLAEQLLRHRLDAVDAAAQVHAIEVELEDLFLGQEDLEHHGQRRFLRLAGERARVGEVERARELLRDGAAALFAGARSQVEDGGAGDGDGIDAGVVVEAVILDGDDGVLEVGGDLLEGHVLPLLVERKPLAPRRVVEHRPADAAIEVVDRHGVASRPTRARARRTRSRRRRESRWSSRESKGRAGPTAARINATLCAMNRRFLALIGVVGLAAGLGAQGTPSYRKAIFSPVSGG